MVRITALLVEVYYLQTVYIINFYFYYLISSYISYRVSKYSFGRQLPGNSVAIFSNISYLYLIPNINLIL